MIYAKYILLLNIKYTYIKKNLILIKTILIL